MKAVIQRVRFAKVEVDGRVVGEIGPGIFTLLGVGHHDSRADVDALIAKILKLRVFEDEVGKMNLSLLDLCAREASADVVVDSDGRVIPDLKYGHLIVSQFTLYADTQKGNRPGFGDAAKPEIAEPLYSYALDVSRAAGVETAGGAFGADMQITLLNDGPVTLVLES